MVKKESSTTEVTKELPVYKVPKVTTYNEADIMADLGEANASDLLNPLYISVEL